MGADDVMRRALELVMQFVALLRGIPNGSLTEWLTSADGSESPELRGFARTLRQDEMAVKAAMEEPWSNGPVEGQVNRLKMIQRQM